MLPILPTLLVLSIAMSAFAQTDAQNTSLDSAATEPSVDSAVKISELEAKVAEDPTDADTWTRLGILFTEEELYDDARGAFISALQAAPSEPLSHLNLGMVLVRMERWVEAQTPLGSYLRMAPGDVRGYALLGRTWARTDDLDQAREVWLEGISAPGMNDTDAVALLQEYSSTVLHDREPSYAELGDLATSLRGAPQLLATEEGAHLRESVEFAYLGRAHLALEAERDIDALQAWADLRSFGTTNDVAWTQPAQLLLDAGKTAEAKELVDDARERRGGVALVDYLDGRVKEQENDLPGAAAAYKRVVRRDPDFPGVNAALGGILATLGDSQGASEALSRAVARGEGGAAASYNMGVVLNKKKQYREAIGHLETAVELDPSRKDAYRALGTAYRKTKQFLKAAKSYQQLVDRFGPDPSDLYQLGFSLAKINRHRDAANNFLMVAALQSENWRAFYSLGNSLREIKSFEEAAKAYETALDLNPGYYYASYNLGYSLQLMGKLEEAIDRYELTLEMRETRAIYVNMAICYTDLGDEETAEEYYRLAEELRQGR